MARVVQKYGGSSVGNIERLDEVAELVCQRRRTGDQVVVVVSAMGATTDSLMAMARQVSPAPPTRELDMLVTAGERISMALLSMAIHKRGVDAVSFTGSQSGIITESTHQGARIVEVRPGRLEDALASGRIVIVAGFQGVSRDREVTTLGRGGSDTTAVALAAALNASTCEIYSDVDGVYSADPRLCPEAAHLPHLSYGEMKLIATAGAKVLHSQAVVMAEREGLTILARKTGDTSGKQTRIDSAADRLAHAPVRAVACHERALFLADEGTARAALIEQLESLAWQVHCADEGTVVLLNSQTEPDEDIAQALRQQLSSAAHPTANDIVAGSLLTLLHNGAPPPATAWRAITTEICERPIWHQARHPVYRWGLAPRHARGALGRLHRLVCAGQRSLG